jgi:signal transduction histidine kinase
MKVIHKIIIGNTLAIISIALIAVFSYHEFNLIHDKLNFVEIADTFNASLLKMRLSEKNYFLYGDKSALLQIKKELVKNEAIIQSLKPNIIRSVGRHDFNKLKILFNSYKNKIIAIDANGSTQVMEAKVREAGHALKRFSENIIKLERKRVNRIISASRKTLLYFFCIIIFAAITATYLLFPKLFKSLRKVERIANAISKGRFEKITGKIPNDEFGSVILAVNSMSEKLQSREDQLVQSKKLASIGILTAGVAHELGNPLNNISMIAQTYLTLYEKLHDQERLDYINTILNETERIRNIVQDLLDFSKPKEKDFNIASLNRVIRNSHRLVRNMLHISGIKSEFSLQEHLPPVSLIKIKFRK